jgi:D-alanyl-D-alanine carboxypeptidase
VAAVDGIKTGYTRSSGFNLLTSAKAGGRHLVAVVLGGRSGRKRDAIMAGLIGQHLPRAYAGHRTGIVIATADDDDDDATPARRREIVARAAPLAPTPTPTLRQPSLTATAHAFGSIAPPPRPVGEASDLRNVRPAVATAKSSPVTPGAPLALHAPAPPPRPEATLPPGAKATHRLTPPADIGARPLSFTGSPDRRAPRPPLDVSPTGSLKSEPDDTDEESAEDEDKPKKKVAGPVKPAPETPKAKPAAPAPAAPPVAEAATRPAQSGWVIQLGATDDKAKALEILERARQRGQTLLAKAKPFTEPVEKGGTTLWRARFAGFEEQDAQAACRALKRSGFSCFATKA